MDEQEPGPQGSDEAISYHSAGSAIDGTVEVSVASDGMTASASFYPPRGEGLPIEPQLVHELLRRIGVVSGILENEIAESVLSCNLERRVIHDVAVARGQSPVAEVPEHARLEEKFQRHSPQIDDRVQRVDFRELATLFIARKDETIATILPRVEGKPGFDVRGREIPAERSNPSSCLPGRNVELRADKLVSMVDGRLSLEGGKADVDEVLLVKGEVDFHTGHILFPGDVIIEGAVHDGFKVWSGGSIVCKATVDAFDINAKKDLVCAQGIIGRRKGEIRVGGDLKAKYIQNCRVAVRGNVHLSSALVGSKLFTLGNLEMGDKGVIMGGETIATHGIVCGRIGNEAFQATKIVTGIDFTIQRKLDEANEKLRMLSVRAKQADQAAALHPGPEVDKARKELGKIAVDLRALITELLGKLDADGNAIVDARREVFPGSVIEICRISIVVEQKLGPSRFRLDKAAGKIVVEHH